MISTNDHLVSIKQLQDNLTQSQRWAEVFRRDVKALLEEITATNHKITQLNKHNFDIRAQIENKKRELKSQTEEKIKLKYKTDKLEIKLQEISIRIKLYEDAQAKKVEWNRQLSNKLMLLEIELERERHSLDELDGLANYSEDKASESRISDSSSNSIFLKENSIKKVLGHPRTQIDGTLKKLKALEYSYLKQSDKCRKLEEELQIVRRKGQKLQIRLSELEISHPQHENQSNHRQGLSVVDQNIPKEARIKAKTLRQLEDKAQNLDREITTLYQKIEEYSTALNELLKGDNQAGVFHREMVALDREVRKEKGTIHSIKNYILFQGKSIPIPNF